MENLIGKTKYYNNRPVVVLKDEGHGFLFVVAELNLSHDMTGSNWCTMCQAGGEFISSHECEVAQEIIDHLMENIEDREVFWVSERYLNDKPFEFKPFKKLVDKIEVLKLDHSNIESKNKDAKSSLYEIEKEIDAKNSELADLNLKIQQAQHDLMTCESEENHKELIPTTLSNAFIEISSSDFVGLLKDSLILNKLSIGGVDNWEWYGESLGDSDFDSEAIINLSNYLKK